MAFFLIDEFVEREEPERFLLPEVVRLVERLPRHFTTVWQVLFQASDYSTRVLRRPLRHARIRP